MNWLVQWYRQIPPELIAPLGALLAAVFTGVVAFTGVVLSNRAAERRQRIELLEAERRARTDRDHVLRERIYLDALNEMGTAVARLFDIWNLQKSPSSISSEAFAASTGATYRSRLVASPQVLSQLAEVALAFAKAASNALPIRIHHASVMQHQQAMADMAESMKAERKRLIEERAAAETTTARSEQIEGRLRELETMAFKLSESAVPFAEKTVAIGLDVITRAMRERSAVERQILALVSAMREDLGLPGFAQAELDRLVAAEEADREVIEKALATAKEMVPSITDKLRSDLDKARKPSASPGPTSSIPESPPNEVPGAQSGATPPAGPGAS